MPPGRRKSAQPAASQRTLAFGPHANKVTKPTHDPPSTLKKQSSLPPKTRLLTPSPPPSVPEEIKSPESNLTIRESKNKPTVKPPRSEIEERAAKVGEGDVGRYWRGKEAERKAPRGTIYPVYALHFTTMGEVNWYIASSEEENSAPASLIYSWEDSAPLWSIKSIRGNIFIFFVPFP